MLEIQAGEGGGFCFTAKRNCSIAPAALCAFFLAAAVTCLAVAVAWAWFGAWLILPFAGLEVMALAAALVLNARHVGDYERISLLEGRLTIEIRNATRLSRYEFNPLWASVVVGSTVGMTQRIALRSHGREIEIGRYLDEDGRKRLAAELRRWLPTVG